MDWLSASTHWSIWNTSNKATFTWTLCQPPVTAGRSVLRARKPESQRSTQLFHCKPSEGKNPLNGTDGILLVHHLRLQKEEWLLRDALPCANPLHTDLVLMKRGKLMKRLSVGQRCSPAEKVQQRNRINSLYIFWAICFAGETLAPFLLQCSLIKQNKCVWDLLRSWSCSTVPLGLQKPKPNE